MEDNLHLEKLIKIVNATPRSCFGEEIIKYIDVNKYLLWLCGVVCTQNCDGFIHNYALHRNGKTRLYEMIPWDYDATWGRNVYGGIMEYDYVPIEGYNTLSARLLDVKEYRNQYRLILEQTLETTFTVAALEPKIRDLYSYLTPYVFLDPHKKNLIDNFDLEPEFILRFVADRSRYLRNHLKDLL
ncbi:CotH protein [Paenibacillus sp. yr247]|nr:CotH protein [Paenibacillus sp. yr247]